MTHRKSRIKRQLPRQKASSGTSLAGFVFLVPTARLELAQLAPLPPQDSVSTNFTTSAKTNILTCFDPFVQWTFHLNE
jgi:hypothetical protein